MESNENTGSCREEDQRSLQREKFEYISIGILCRDAAIDAQECYEWEQQEYWNCYHQDYM